MVKRKRANNDLQNTTLKAKDRSTLTPQNSGLNAGAPKGKEISAPHIR